MKIHAYRVFQAGPISLNQVFLHIQGLPLDQRLIDVSGTPLRVEEAIPGGNEWSVDFAAIKREGPGRADCGTGQRHGGGRGPGRIRPRTAGTKSFAQT